MTYNKIKLFSLTILSVCGLLAAIFGGLPVNAQYGDNGSADSGILPPGNTTGSVYVEDGQTVTEYDIVAGLDAVTIISEPGAGSGDIVFTLIGESDLPSSLPGGDFIAGYSITSTGVDLSQVSITTTLKIRETCSEVTVYAFSPMQQVSVPSGVSTGDGYQTFELTLPQGATQLGVSASGCAPIIRTGALDTLDLPIENQVLLGSSLVTAGLGLVFLTRKLRKENS
jgi:hypothetical protein